MGKCYLSKKLIFSRFLSTLQGGKFCCWRYKFQACRSARNALVKGLKDKNLKNKNTIRKIESVIELLVMAILYYFVYYYIHEYAEFVKENIYPLVGRGKYVLMGVYFGLMLVIIHLCDGFKYGILKIADVLFSQWIAIFIVNVVTYFQLCLMANTMIPVKPILLLTVGDFVISGIFVYIFFAIYERYAKASKLLMVYGNKESVGIQRGESTRCVEHDVWCGRSRVESRDYGSAAQWLRLNA